MASRALLIASYHSRPRRAEIYEHLQRVARAVPDFPEHIYEYTVPNLVGWYVAVPDVPGHWEAMDACQVSRFFAIMPSAMPWQNDAVDLHEVALDGAHLDGKTYEVPDVEVVLR